MAKLLVLFHKFKNPENFSISHDEFGNESVKELKSIIMKGLKKLNMCNAKFPVRNS